MSALVALTAVCGSAAYASQGASLSAQSATGHARGDLLYTAVTFCSQRPPYCSANVGIYTYPAGKYVSGWSQEGGTGGACADAAGNVYVGYGGPSGPSQILEFAHGGNTPIAILNLPMGTGLSTCSVDPITGNLAVASGGFQGLLVFEGSATPTIYNAPGLDINVVGYDNHSDAIVGGPRESAVALAELPAGGTVFDPITLDQSIGTAGTIQWDGSEMTILDPGGDTSVVYRFVVRGKHGKVVGMTSLLAMDVGADVIDRGRILASVNGGVCTQTCPPDALAFFNFPTGGQIVSYVKGASTDGGFAISFAPHGGAPASRTKQHGNARR